MYSAKKIIYKIAKRIIPNDINVRVTESSVVMGSSSDVYVDMYTAPKTGFFLGSISISYPSNSTGIRAISSARKAMDGTYTNVDAQNLNVPACNGGRTILTMPVFLPLFTGQSLAIRGWQNSGSSITADYFLARGFFFTDN